MKIEQVRTNISGIFIGGGKIATSRHSFCPMHLHTETEFLYVLQGIITVECGNAKFDIHGGEVAMIGRSVPHSTERYSGIPTASILFQVNIEKFSFGENKSLQNLQGFLNEIEFPYYCFKKGDPITEQIIECITNIKNENIHHFPGNDLLIKSYIYKLTGLLYRNNILDDYFSKIDIKSLNRLLPALLYIDRNLKENITLESVAKAVHLNAEYFSRLFKKITGKNIFSYINYVRISNACKLLVDTDLSVLDVAMESGYTSISNFNRHFLKIKDCTPSTYRKMKSEGIKI